MIKEQDVLSFQKKLEERDFILDDRLLDQLLKGKMERLRQQNADIERIRKITKKR